jgi:molybdopterin-guanine dinucleotide biosynthesis protein A
MFRAHLDGSGGLHAWLEELSPRYDLILVEGHKATPLPKVWLNDGAGTPPPAEAGNMLLELPLEADRVEAMLRFLEDRLRRAVREAALFGCILIGGQSRRMSQAKHLIEEGGQTWIERIANRLGEAVQEIVILGDGALPGSLEGTTRLSDIPGVRGPMAGLLAAMRWNPRASWLAAACDMPGISRAALEWLKAARRPGVWAILPSLEGAADKVEPLLAYYDFRARHLLETAVGEGDFVLKHLTARGKVITPRPPAELIGAWRNINCPEDLQAYRASLDWDH